MPAWKFLLFLSSHNVFFVHYSIFEHALFYYYLSLIKHFQAHCLAQKSDNYIRNVPAALTISDSLFGPLNAFMGFLDF
jgi:hypothetical protein